jgi:hypothetical protein
MNTNLDTDSARRHAFAQDEGLVQIALKTAAASNITVQELRGNVSVVLVLGEISPSFRVETVKCSSTQALRVCVQRSRQPSHPLVRTRSST